MRVETDKGIFENVVEVSWFGCDMYLTIKGKTDVVIVEEPKTFSISSGEV